MFELLRSSDFFRFIPARMYRRATCLHRWPDIAALGCGSVLGRALLLSICLSITACETPNTIDEASALNFLRTGETLREEVILRLGIPTASFENDRILTYRLAPDEKAGVKSNWYGPYQLVLVFDEGGRLAEHKFLQP